MNHYDRLKVSQDAPPEVIRAAYRALANRLHPDRNGGGAGPADEAHEEMAALNAAYEVLIDPMLRKDYDATLVTLRSWSGAPGAADVATTEPAAMPAGGLGSGGVAGLAGTVVGQPDWYSVRRNQAMVGVAALALAVLAGALYWRAHQGPSTLDAAVSEHVQRQVALRGDVDPAAAMPADSASPQEGGRAVRRPTVEELARMSDEELLRALPELDRAAAPAPARAAAGPHPLDGTPLPLKVDKRLVDPLAEVSRDRP